MNTGKPLTKEHARLREERHTDDVAVRVRTRIDLYCHVPEQSLPAVRRPVDLRPKFRDPSEREVVEGLLERGVAPKRVRLKPESPEAVRSVDRYGNPTSNIEGDRALIAGLVALDLEWTRNPPAVADTFSIVVRGDALPVDLDLFSSIQVFGWLFVHEDAGEDLDQRQRRCRPGDPGCFGGIVDEIERDDAEGVLRLECRDFTAVLLAREAGPALIKSCDVAQPLPQIVEYLVRAVPGGDNWVVETRGQVGGKTLSQRLSEEKRTLERKGFWSGVPIRRPEVKKTQARVPSRRTLRFGGAGGRFDAGLDLEQTEEPLSQVPVGPPPPVKRVYTPAKYKTKIQKPTPDRVFGTSKQSIWEAITKACSLAGVVAEVGVSSTGQPMVVLVDGLEIQQGTVFRAFERGKRKHRVVTHGADLGQLVERRQLTGGRRVRWVEVYSTDPVTGKTLRERFDDGPAAGTIPGTEGAAKEHSTDNGITLFAHGTHSAAELQHLARVAFSQVNRGELELTFSLQLPWTTGGSVFDADLLWCASGALMEVQFARADRFRGLQLEEALRRLGVPREAAAKLARASERLQPSLVFQVAELMHTVGADGEYRADIIAQRMLGAIRDPKGSSLETT